MAKKECETCAEVWDTRQCFECPTCRSIREQDLKQARHERLLVSENLVDNHLGYESQVEKVHNLAEDAARSARNLKIMTIVVGFLGVIGGMLIFFSGLYASYSPNYVVVASGIGIILFWLLVWAFGIAFAARILLTSAEAKLHVDEM